MLVPVLFTRPVIFQMGSFGCGQRYPSANVTANCGGGGRAGLVAVLATTTGRAVGATVRGVVGVAAGVLVDSGVAVSSGVGVKVGRGVNVGRGVRVGVAPPSEIKVPASQASPANTTSIATKNKNSRLIFKSETPFRARQVPPRDASAKRAATRSVASRIIILLSEGLGKSPNLGARQSFG